VINTWTVVTDTHHFFSQLLSHLVSALANWALLAAYRRSPRVF